MQTNKEKRREYAKKYRDSGQAKAWQIKCRYGISPAELEARILVQGGKCAVCEVDLDHKGFSGKLAGKRYVDHDHATGKVRGIVHMRCNTLMGLAGDDPDLLEKAAKYLRSKRG